MTSGQLVIVFVALTRFLVVHADPKPDASAKQRAGELAAQSAEHYKRGELEISVALLRQAYALYPEPNLQYNLARSLEGLGDRQGAVDAYETYLAAAPTIEDRGAIERRVATLKAELAEAAQRARPANPPPVVVQPTPQPREMTPSRMPWVLMLGGVAIVGAGVVFGVRSSSRHDDAVGAMVGTEAAELQNDARRLATIANALFVVGSAAIVGGVVWEIVNRRSGRVVRSAQLRIGPGSIAFEVKLP